MKGKKRVHAFKNRMEHWQVVSIGLTVYDAIAMILAFFLALWFRFDCRYTMIPKEYLNFYFKFILIYAVISIFVFRKMRLYNSIWRFASYSELLRTVVATGITFVIHCVGMNVFFGKMPLSYYVFGIMIQFVLTLGVRFAYRFVLLERSRQRKAEEIAKAKKVLLIGAGKAGQMILRDIKTEFVAVRFGNVLGSNGSVVPLLKKQIASGGPVTVTHPDIIRYFMTIPEAVSLVLQAGTYAKGGEIFVLDMGSPVKIDTLARNLIKLSGLKPDIDIKIEYTGLRPGEKLYEEKLMAEEGLKKTPNDLIHIGCPIPFEVEGFLKHLQSLMEMAYANDEHIREKVSEIVTTYHPAGEHGSEKKGEVYERLLGGKTAENGQK